MIVAGVEFNACTGAEKFTVNDVLPAAEMLSIDGAAGAVVPAKSAVAAEVPVTLTALIRRAE